MNFVKGQKVEASTNIVIDSQNIPKGTKGVVVGSKDNTVKVDFEDPYGRVIVSNNEIV
jgi:outer membrane lipoprotein-sorting protein